MIAWLWREDAQCEHLRTTGETTPKTLRGFPYIGELFVIFPWLACRRMLLFCFSTRVVVCCRKAKERKGALIPAPVSLSEV
jgi:hypothetical protein